MSPTLRDSKSVIQREVARGRVGPAGLPRQAPNDLRIPGLMEAALPRPRRVSNSFASTLSVIGAKADHRYCPCHALDIDMA